MIKKLIIICLFSITSLMAKENTCPVVILGGGMGGLTSALYLARAGIRPCLIEGQVPGGLITQSKGVENWPGEKNISGYDLVEKVRQQVKQAGCDFISSEVIAVDFSSRPFQIKTKDLFSNKENTLYADSCIIAMGTSPNFLQVEGEKEYYGRGVTHCAVCDGGLYKDKVAVVIGGSEKAIEEALYLSNIAKQVVIICRKDNLRFLDKMRYNELLKKENVQIIKDTVVKKIKGHEQKPFSIVTENLLTQKQAQISADGIFLAIGSKPNTQIFADQLQLDANGYILLQKGQKTSCKGVFAVGDITDPVYKQAITASGHGAIAAIEAQKYLQTLNKKTETVVHIQSQEQFERELQEKNILICVDFYATWCGPCRMLSPYLDTFAKDLSGKVKILKVNVDQFPQISSSYQVKAMPTLIMIKDQKNMQKITGLYKIREIFESMYHDSYETLINRLENQ